jgi:putative membrane protein
MKRFYASFAGCMIAAFLFSCGNNDSETTATTDSSTVTATTPDSLNNANTANTTPLAKEDSSFVLEAAMGSMMEVEAGNIAQQNAANQRVKDFGSMMVTDHSQANNELKSLVAGRVTIPDSLDADKRKHLDAMRKMTGKSFDSHYMGMMVKDHKEDVSKFENASRNLQDPQLKQWAEKTLPVLKKHMDSAQAVSKAK